MREARRSVDIKIFKAEIKHANQEEPITMYFTNRIEIGKAMQNNRMNYVHEFLNDHEEVKNTKAHEEMVK